MYVCNRFTIEICGFTRSLHTILAHAAHDAIAMEVEDSEDRKQCQNESRRLINLQKDERQQDNGDRRRLARQYPSNLPRF